MAVNADLSPDRRIHASAGQARNLYSELMRNMATRTRPRGNALTAVVEVFVNSAQQEAEKTGTSVSSVINDRLSSLAEHVGGYDFAKVIEVYWRGHENDDDELKSNAIRWLRAEYSTKTDARKALGVGAFISDNSFYSSLKLMSLLVKQGRLRRAAGRSGRNGEPLQAQQQAGKNFELRTDSGNAQRLPPGHGRTLGISAGRHA